MKSRSRLAVIHPRWPSRAHDHVHATLVAMPVPNSLALCPKVVITTEQRRGHHVTLVAELNTYSIDPYAAARELQVDRREA